MVLRRDFNDNFIYFILYFFALVVGFATLFLCPVAYAFDANNTAMPSQVRSLGGGNSLPTTKVPTVIQGVDIKENLGKNLDLNLSFTDTNNKSVKVSDMLADHKPLLLTLNYYNCTTLCSIQLINLAKTLKELGWTIGKDFNVATISFDPADTAAIAAQKQLDYRAAAGQKDGNWNFYVGQEENIKKLTQSLGFYYKYDPVSKEFAHAAAIFIISPTGKISRYLYGITYKPLDIKFALMDAAENKIGSAADKVLLTCFHYNPVSGKYDAFAMGLLRIAGIVTILILLILFLYYLRRERKR